MATAELLERKRRFAHVFAETGKPTTAARASGLIARDAQSDPFTKQLIEEFLLARLTRLAPVALTVLERLATDENVSPAVRRLAASDILDRAGIVRLAPQATRPESLSAMPAHDLRALVYRLESELFERANPVLTLEHSPKDITDEPKPLSVLD